MLVMSAVLCGIEQINLVRDALGSFFLYVRVRLPSSVCRIRPLSLVVYGQEWFAIRKSCHIFLSCEVMQYSCVWTTGVNSNFNTDY